MILDFRQLGGFSIHFPLMKSIKQACCNQNRSCHHKPQTLFLSSSLNLGVCLLGGGKPLEMIGRRRTGITVQPVSLLFDDRTEPILDEPAVLPEVSLPADTTDFNEAELFQHPS